eukprot:14142-Heterococcus_DN1.PRE.3
MTHRCAGVKFDFELDDVLKTPAKAAAFKRFCKLYKTTNLDDTPVKFYQLVPCSDEQLCLVKAAQMAEDMSSGSESECDPGSDSDSFLDRSGTSSCNWLPLQCAAAAAASMQQAWCRAITAIRPTLSHLHTDDASNWVKGDNDGLSFDPTAAVAATNAGAASSNSDT